MEMDEGHGGRRDPWGCMISYCIAAYRPTFCKLLVDDLARKTSVPYEILIWDNTGDQTFSNFLVDRSRAGVRVNIVGSTPENIGMRGYYDLFKAARYPLVVQVDDDVVRVSRNIAQICASAFDRHPKVRQIASDLWTDEFTWGNRPPNEHYRPWSETDGLLGGPIDGWFSVMHASVIPLVLEKVTFGKYFSLGLEVRAALEKNGMLGLLSTRFKVLHVVGGPYLSYFGMLESEGRKWAQLKGEESPQPFIDLMTGGGLPSREAVEKKVLHAYATIDAMGENP